MKEAKKLGFGRLDTEALAKRAQMMHRIKRAPGLHVKTRKARHKRGEATTDDGWIALDSWGRMEYNPNKPNSEKVKKHLITNNPMEKLPGRMDSLIHYKKQEGHEFSIVEKGNVRYLYDARNNLRGFAYYINRDKAIKMSAKGGEFWGEGLSFAAGMGLYISLSKQIKKYITCYMDQNNGELPRSLKAKVVRYRNQDLWKSLPPDTRFHALDLNNCWFQMAYRLGYISKSMYHTWRNQKEYKNVLRRFMPMLSSTKAFYKYKGKKIVKKGMDPFSLSCKALFDNIRSEASKHIEAIIEIVGHQNVIYANTDEIAVIVGENGTLRKVVAEYFIENRLEYKVALCRKIDNSAYQHGSKTKKWGIKKG